MELIKPTKLNITDKDFEILTKLVSKYIPKTKIWFYGSRITNNHRETSDLDMVIFLPKEKSNICYDLKEAFDESDLTFRVDLFIWDNIPEEFKENITNNHISLEQ